jgi:hypothetical protein
METRTEKRIALKNSASIKANQKPRFQVLKLEERIAPRKFVSPKLLAPKY